MDANVKAKSVHSQDSSTSASSTEVPRSSKWERLSADQARKYWVSLANLKNDPAAAQKFEKVFGGLLPVRGWEPGRVALVKVGKGDHEKPAHEGLYDEQNAPLPDYLWRWRENVRLVWEAPDLRTRRWRIERLRHKALLQADRRFLADEAFNLTLPPPTPAERAIEYLARCADLLAICRNELCAARYFIGKRRGMKYCGEDCYAPILQQARREWWTAHGKQWRARRKKSRSRTNRKRREPKR